MGGVGFDFCVGNPPPCTQSGVGVGFAGATFEHGVEGGGVGGRAGWSLARRVTKKHLQVLPAHDLTVG